jgi:NADH dehydrogenase [ubiquinone] 1 alpha subcomplex assembly factor 7
MSEAAGERRETPLARELKEEIRRTGPITIAAYMQACLQHPAHGYYREAAAVGAAGDFITAPEVSQTFGEIVGLWAAVVWQRMGRPYPVNLIELGPGRGTLLADALRAGRLVPGFVDAARVALVETNARLRAGQAEKLSAHLGSLAWHARLAEVASGPAILVANEFLDALPIRQFVRREGGLAERRVGLSPEGELEFVEVAAAGSEADCAKRGAPGELVEVHPGYEDVAADLAGRAAATPLAAVFIDYGHTEPAAGDTLQAVRQHRPEHPLCSPGEADLTAHVDFAAFAVAIAAAAAGSGARLAIDGPVTQAEFLGALGIMERASRLMAANPGRAHEIEAAVVRLMAVPGMGDRFKAIGVRSLALPALPGLPPTR